MQTKVFEIAPVQGFANPALIAVAVLLIALLGLFGYIGYSTRHARFEISPAGLRIAGDLYGRTVPLSKIDPEQVRVLDLTQDREHGLSWRTNGVGLPGYASGWFKLRNGEKALVFVTNRSKVVYVPTRDGYSVLMSVSRPEEFVQAITAAAAK